LGLGGVVLFAVGCAGMNGAVVMPEPPVQGAAPADTSEVAEASGAEGPHALPPGADPGASDWGILDRARPDYAQVIGKVAGMVGDGTVQQGVARRGLALQNVNWEDTGRAMGSALGPNISDLTLQVRRRDPSGQFVSALMPVIRFPNFTDRTGDIPADRFFVRVGNERRGQELRSVPLAELLRDLKSFVSVPASIRGSGNLLAPRDSHFLVSAQAVFLPIPHDGKAEFNPVLFNYQSAPGSPAVLSILVTRQGTSVQVIENRPDESSSAVGAGQELYFNNAGQRAAFTAERKSDVEARIQAQGGPRTADDRSALQRGADVLFLIQVPLMHANQGVLGGVNPPQPPPAAPAAAAPAKKAEAAMDKESDVEQAVLGHGPNLGPFNEGRGLRLVRDASFPIRVTVQFYKATSNGVISERDLDGIAKSIGNVYEHADYVGSLVMPEGDARRPTAWQKVPGQWFPW
jgi:hypothetical protein